MSSMSDERRSLIVAAAMYRCALAKAEDVVDAATDLLAGGEGGMLLAQLAGIPKGQADMEVGPLLASVMDSLAAPLYDAGSAECQLLTVEGWVDQCRRGSMESRELTRRIHERFGHVSPPVIEVFASLDGKYDLLVELGATKAEVDREVESAMIALTAAVDQILVSRHG